MRILWMKMLLINFELDVEREIQEREENCESSKYFETPQLFLEYLDKHFQPEINLDEIEEQIFGFKDINSQIKLNYKGHKHMNEKGKNAERRDVAYKTFIRSIRRYLWELFSKKYEVSKTKLKNIPHDYK